MIWDFIRDFFVQFIFGGSDSSGEHYFLTYGWNWVEDSEIYNSDMGSDIGGVNITMGDWLSTTATIVCMCLIVFLLICLVRWIFRVVSSAFLLK